MRVAAKFEKTPGALGQLEDAVCDGDGSAGHGKRLVSLVLADGDQLRVFQIASRFLQGGEELDYY